MTILISSQAKIGAIAWAIMCPIWDHTVSACCTMVTADAAYINVKSHKYTIVSITQLVITSLSILSHHAGGLHSDLYPLSLALTAIVADCASIFKAATLLRFASPLQADGACLRHIPLHLPPAVGAHQYHFLPLWIKGLYGILLCSGAGLHIGIPFVLSNLPFL